MRPGLGREGQGPQGAACAVLQGCRVPKGMAGRPSALSPPHPALVPALPRPIPPWPRPTPPWPRPWPRPFVPSGPLLISWAGLPWPDRRHRPCGRQGSSLCAWERPLSRALARRAPAPRKQSQTPKSCCAFEISCTKGTEGRARSQAVTGRGPGSSGISHAPLAGQWATDWGHLPPEPPKVPSR